jgi:cytochrome c-type biogenesis protein CcmH/NrfF
MIMQVLHCPNCQDTDIVQRSSVAERYHSYTQTVSV